ncbi:TPR repeat-containing protein [Actinidia chinensis var. chinensis]|uniref:TPR repeat-containing protein n=1 Tax=Actinidia chinensis var. chinensis TaxID=1590841 RepID=A0A2R6P685_ACTCC|nr:TPR repeat-containing protein [Actinidia chinensis var. chinensis]
MGVNVATASLHWSQSSVPHPPSSPQTLVSTVSSPSLKRRSFSDGALVFRCIQRLDRSALFGTNLCRSYSLDQPKSKSKSIRRASSAGLDSFSDEEFSRKIQELAMKFQLSDDDEDTTKHISESEIVSRSDSSDSSNFNFTESRRPFEPLEPPDWAVAADEIIPASIERRANSVDLPLSLRIIKRKQKQWREEVREAGESAYCSVKKAFSSMVFIIRELQSFSLQMREKLFYEDMQGILARVQNEMHASFVWLFQQVFSHTPTLMVYVMILLANYSVHSMYAVAAPPPPPVAASVSIIEHQNHKQTKFDSPVMKTFSVSGGKTTSIGGNNGGGGGKLRPVAGGTDGGGRFDAAEALNTVIPDGVSTTAREEESVSGQVAREEELMLWNSIVEEASRMQAAVRDEALDQETVGRFVSPVTAKIEADDYADYFKTELLYRTGLAHEPSNPLLLANFAQFLYLVAHDYDRAEEYFKRAVRVEPPDAEALSKYAIFLWQARKDLWAAEETYLEAISADPANSYYAANYAHFLWNTGGEDTCFPLDTTNTNDA